MEERTVEYRFGAYLKTRVCYRQIDYIRSRTDIVIEDWEHEDLSFDLDQEVFARNPLYMSISDPRLVFALHQLSSSELYIFLSHVLEERQFSEISRELGISHVLIGSLYHSTITEIRQHMEAYDHGFRGYPAFRKNWCSRCKAANSRAVQAHIAEALHRKWAI